MDPDVGYKNGNWHPLQPYHLMVNHPSVFWSIVCHVNIDVGANEVIS